MKRNLDIEVLRCFLMLIIVIYHGCNNGPFSVDGENHDVKFLAWFLFWATNAFVFISGWFGIRFSWRKVLKFLGLGLYASVLLMLLSPFVAKGFSWRFSLGWFGNSYLALMLVSPLINAGLEALEAKSKQVLCVAWIAYAVAMFLSWLPLNSYVKLGVPGWMDGHSFNTMLFIYVSAYVLKRSAWFCGITRMRAIIIFALAQICHVLLLGAVVVSPACKNLLAGALDYNSPALLVMGAMMFMIFYRTNFPSWLKKTAFYISPSVFMVYLLHSGGNPVVAEPIFHGVLSSVDNMFMPVMFHRVFAVIVGGVAIFLACVICDIIRRCLIYACYSLKRWHPGI